MKFSSLIIGLFMLFVFTDSNAQTITSCTGSDTIANTATVNLLLTVRNFYETGAFQVTNTKLSGTAAGTTKFQGSVDGTNYVTIDTLLNLDQTTNTKIFTDVPTRYPYYRLTTTGVGTMSVITVGKAHFKK